MTGRSKGCRISQAQRRKFAVQLRALIEADPNITRDKLVNLTGAPFAVCDFIRKQMKRERVA